jgi:uncharacterized membrane protein
MLSELGLRRRYITPFGKISTENSAAVSASVPATFRRESASECARAIVFLVKVLTGLQMNANSVAASTSLKSVAWLGMSLLALGVAAYAFAIVITPALRSPFAEGLLIARPVVAPTHFIFGGIAIVVGALQVNRLLRTRCVSLHRWLGRSYVLAVAIGGVAGIVLALHSSSGLVATAGFGSLGVLWLVTTLMGYRCIRQHNTAAHRSWMIRSYALALAAVTLRLYMPLSDMLGLSMAVAYPVISWLAWVPNLLIAEWFVRPERPSIAPSRSAPVQV